MVVPQWYFRLVPIVAIIIYSLDRITKIIALNFLEQPLIILENFFSFHLVINEGFFFGINFPPRWTITVVVILLLLVVFIYTAEYAVGHFFSSLLLALIGVAAFSNLWDRIRYGGVIDFIYVFELSTFNFADIIIIVAVCLWLIPLWQQRKKTQA